MSESPGAGCEKYRFPGGGGRLAEISGAGGGGRNSPAFLPGTPLSLKVVQELSFEKHWSESSGRSWDSDFQPLGVTQSIITTR